MTRNHRSMAAVLVVGILSGAVFAQSRDPLIGTWKLNAAKSKGMKGGTTKIEAAGEGVKFSSDLVGAAAVGEFTVLYVPYYVTRSAVAPAR